MATSGKLFFKTSVRNREARECTDAKPAHRRKGADGPSGSVFRKGGSGGYEIGAKGRGRGGLGGRDRGQATRPGIQGLQNRGPEGRNPKKTKHRWVQPQQKVLWGSASEGHGFALWRKRKVQLEYKKLLRKQKKVSATKEVQYTDNYPEHLKHLYLAEEEKLKNQEKRRRPETDSAQAEEESTSETPRKKFKKKTSNQKAKEAYEKVQQERASKREEAEKRRKEREEAQRLYKKKKMESFKILSAKTKKGQPNFNLQMEYLLQKIQQDS
ncbi:thyroid transcription factor 1-associated protein 26 [Spea bombifrons]|uniref:thyroid transcription factor 1-associated protein 26 n=1 Tax=Spea bombifrons TaxID=233779 RepID=UPI0023494CDA|nr:thyroid transcription factor 1-associated protein 26 [Spea bombifrons]